MAKDNLIDSLDEAAANLLERSKDNASVSVGEQVRVFETMAKYAELRIKLVPPKKEISKFDVIKGEFRGTADRKAKRRGTSAETDETTEVSTSDT